MEAQCLFSGHSPHFWLFDSLNNKYGHCLGKRDFKPQRDRKKAMALLCHYGILQTAADFGILTILNASNFC